MFLGKLGIHTKCNMAPFSHIAKINSKWINCLHIRTFGTVTLLGKHVGKIHYSLIYREVSQSYVVRPSKIPNKTEKDKWQGMYFIKEHILMVDRIVKDMLRCV